MLESIGTLLRYATEIFQWWVLVMPWERGLRVRCGKWIKELDGGIHFRIPYVDALYVQTTRTRVVDVPLQTIQTKDNKPLSILTVFGYSISDILLVYQTLFHPESTIVNMVMGMVADFVTKHTLEECTPDAVEAYVLDQLDLTEYGFNIEYFKVVGYTVVKTFRLIQDNHYTSMPNNMDIELQS